MLTKLTILQFKALHSGTLTASLASPSLEKPIDSLNDLANSEGKRLMLKPSTSSYDIFAVYKFDILFISIN